MRSMDAFHTNTWGTEMHVVAGRDVAEINCYPLGGVAKGQIVTKAHLSSIVFIRCFFSLWKIIDEEKREAESEREYTVHTYK